MYKHINFTYGATLVERMRVNSNNVGSFLDAYGPTYGIPESGVNYTVNGQAATRSTTLNDGDRLVVEKQSGTKG